jgi:hypothetical protein
MQATLSRLRLLSFSLQMLAGAVIVSVGILANVSAAKAQQTPTAAAADNFATQQTAGFTGDGLCFEARLPLSAGMRIRKQTSRARVVAGMSGCRTLNFSLNAQFACGIWKLLCTRKR